MAIGKRIRRLRGKQSRKNFAKSIGIVENTLRNYEEEFSLPNSDVIIEICRRLNVSPQWLLFGDGPEEQTVPIFQAGAATTETPGVCARCIILEKELAQERENSRKKDEALIEGFKKIEENGELRLEVLKLQMALVTAQKMLSEQP